MSDTDTASDRLDEVALLVARAVDVLAGDRSVAAVAGEIQARAALEALRSAGATIGEATSVEATDTDAAADLARAERVLIALPPIVRGQVAVCAAAAYLRRARRALARS